MKAATALVVMMMESVILRKGLDQSIWKPHPLAALDFQSKFHLAQADLCHQ
jgi:hypothetical protein